MSTRFTLHKLVLASAVAAMMAAAAPAAFAQMADTPSTPTTDPNASAPTTSGPMSPGMSTSSMPMSGDMSNMPTDYKILNNRYFDGTDIEQAKARGLSDNQIATVVKIAKKTGMPFGQVVSMVERGKTFPAIATESNLRLSDIYNVDKEKQEISDYMSLAQYEKSLGKSGSMMDMPMSGSPMSAPPMTPPAPMPASSSTSSATPTLDIVDTAMAAKNLTTLVKALQIAGLVETLKGAGPFTVFAPTDRAFAKLPAGALDALEADPAKLKMVLTYHVIPQNIMASDAMAMTSPTSPPTVEGATLQITKGKRGRLKVNNANVVKADIQATNGTIHIIDAVLMPPMDAAMPMDTTTPTPAPMDATPPAAPATPPTDNTAPPVAPATPGQ
jgi:uncharacterized surface protein with fasciclin (FAS1) repeats